MDLNGDIIRGLVLAGNGAAIRDLLITDTQVKLVELVGEQGEMTSNKLAIIHGTTIQNACAQLRRLYQHGYLDKITTDATHGGTENTYHPKAF